MESTEKLQQDELTALQSIYAEDFVIPTKQTAWKGAPTLPEFSIRIGAHSTKVSINLNVKLPKTYPTLACPIFTITQPIKGLNNDQVKKLSNEIHTEAQTYRGSVMVFPIANFCEDWLTTNITPPIDLPGSLAVQMTQRTIDAEKARKQKEEEDAELETLRLAQLAQELNDQIEADAQHQQELRLQEIQLRARRRANSEATEVPYSGDIPMEIFSEEIEMNGVQFDTVRYFHPRHACLGTIYAADPVFSDPEPDSTPTLTLDLYVVTFDAPYYITSQGRKKLKQVEAEIQRLTAVRHANVLRVLAVKLSMPHPHANANHSHARPAGSPQLIVLSEQGPALTLHDVLEDCSSLREDRASDYLGQILSGLNAIHTADLVHRGITARCIGLATRDDNPSQSKLIKLGKVGFHTRLVDLNKSNAFSENPNAASPGNGNGEEGHVLPDAWLSKDVKNESSLLYTRHRDIHSVGIVFLQMLLGLDVTERFSDVHIAVRTSSISPDLQTHIMNMILPAKKSHVSCLSLLDEQAEMALHAQLGAGTTPIPISAGMNGPRTPMMPNFNNSPEIDYFRGPAGVRAASRWKEDWEELELLGKGAFGSVVKARNKIDSRIYAVKKVRLKTMQSDTKIFREVNALSRLSHRFIVRYYTTWVETYEPHSTAPSDTESSTDSGTEDGLTSVPPSSSGTRSRSDSHKSFALYDDLDELGAGGSASKGSFPSIRFTRSSDSSEEDTDSDGERQFAADELFMPKIASPASPRPLVQRTLYIQMEFVERQTLKERVDEGLSKDEAWRLFQQILEALMHMSSLGILHRDIKLTNIFIDAKGDCKVGDFGLATSSLAAVDPSDLSTHIVALDADMTLEVGTRLYIAPEVQSRRRGPTNHLKADMYSLGIVFFEMNFPFSTGAERIAVIEKLRKPEVEFPPTWNTVLHRQRQIIAWLLQHDPDKRPTAQELSQSPLLPQRVEDENLRNTLRIMAKPDSPHHEAVLSSLFNQPPRPSRNFLYDADRESPEFASLNGVVQERLATIFQLHGAVDMEPPLFMPLMSAEEEKKQATFIDRHGDVVTLPNDILIPFARLAARAEHTRIKRYHITDVYRPNAISGHPKSHKAAAFDIITPDLISGPVAAAAEILVIADKILDSFPNLAQSYEIHVSHSSIVDIAMNRVSPGHRSIIVDVLSQQKSSVSQKRALLLKKGILRSTVDELEILADIDANVDNVVARLDKISTSLTALMRRAIDEVKATIQHAAFAGVTKQVSFRPLMVGTHHMYYKDGVLVEIVKKGKRMDILAAGGRYDNLISYYSPPQPKHSPVCAYGLRVSMDKIKTALHTYQSSSLKSFMNDERSFGFWSRRRCDVYVVSSQAGCLQDRLEVASYLWQHNISADIMYESGLQLTDHVDICASEGILFILYPRPRAERRDLPAFRVKSILKGYDTDISRQELVPWLRQEITEQRRIDMATAGAPVFFDNSQIPTSVMKQSSTVVQPVLPAVDMKKQRKTVKNIFEDRAYDLVEEIKKQFLQPSSMPTIVIDVGSTVFDSMVKSSSWLHDEDAWKPISAGFPSQHHSSSYPQQIREAVLKKKAEGAKFVMLFNVKDDRVQLLNLL